MPSDNYKDCVDACAACATTCSYCASQCLQEDDLKNLIKCIRMDLECAALCRAAAELMSLGSNYSGQLCHICADACSACATECEKHAQKGMEHCRECAEACRKCATAC